MQQKCGTYKEIKGCTATPDKGAAPATVDTTTLANKKMRTSINGLQEAGQLEYTFNMEDPSATANIKIANDMAQDTATNGTKYWFKETLSNGVIHAFEGMPFVTWTGSEIDGLLTFTLGITLSSEIEVTFPTVA